MSCSKKQTFLYLSMTNYCWNSNSESEVT